MFMESFLNFNNLIESFEDPETYAAYGGLASDNKPPIKAESHLTGQSLDKGSGAQTPDAYMKVGDTSSVHEVKMKTSTTDYMGQKKVNISDKGEFSLGGKDTPMTALAKNMGILDHIKRSLPAGHSFKEEGQIEHRSHGTLRATRGAAAVTAAGQQIHGKNQLPHIPLTGDQFREHAKNISKHGEDYLHIEGVAAGIPYHHEHPHVGDKNLSKQFAHTALSKMSDEHIKELGPYAVVRAKYGSQKAGYSAEMSVRFKNPEALHKLGSPHTTVSSFRHGVIDAGGTHEDTGHDKVQLFSGHYQNPDGTYHTAGVNAMHAAIAKLNFHGRSHDTDRLFSSDAHMTDYMDNHHDPKEVEKHTKALEKGFVRKKPTNMVGESTKETSVKENAHKLYDMLEQRGDEFTPTIGGPSLERTGGAFGNLMGRAMQAAKQKADDTGQEDAYQTPAVDAPEDPEGGEPKVTPTTQATTEWDQDGDGVPDSIQPPEETPIGTGTVLAPTEEPTEPVGTGTVLSVTVNQSQKPPNQTMSGPLTGEVSSTTKKDEQKSSGKNVSPSKAENFTMPGMDYFAENIKTTFLDYLKEKNIDLGMSGMLGDPVLKDPKKKKTEEAAIYMFAPIAYQMTKESRARKDKLINNKDSKDQ